MTASSLYVGRVRHRRMSGPSHVFTYSVWHALLDLDETPELADRLVVFSHNRLNLASFYDRDHMGPEALPVRDKLEGWLANQGVQPANGPIYLLTQLSLFGHVFNPVSFFFCCDDTGRTRHVVAEVSNTFGETYCYLLEADRQRTVVRHETDKVFHVSPFQPVDGRYRFRVTPPGERMTVHIDVLRDGVRAFDATLSLERRPLTNASLLGTVLSHPHTGLRTLALIHYQALRLWLKRARFYTKPKPPPGAWRTRHG